MKNAAHSAVTSPATEESDAQQAKQSGKLPLSEDQPSAADLAAVREVLAKKYPAIDQDSLTEAAIRGMLQSLDDPYADYYSTEQMADIQQQITGSFIGIGAELLKEKDRVVVRGVLAESPAEYAGLQPDDEIQQIDGQAVNGNLRDVTKRIRGTAHTVVTLRVRKKDGTEVDLAITRWPIHFSGVCGLWRDQNGQWRYWLGPDQKLAYVQVAGIDREAAKRTAELIENLKRQGLKGLVLDLRDSPGGLLLKAIEIVRLFQKEGRLLTVKGENGEFTYDADASGWMGDFPLLVLINGATSSSAEVVAGALQERGRAVVVGERTHGKGSIQSFVAIEGGTGLKVTFAEMFLPSGRRLQRVAGEPAWGVDPSDGFYVPLTAEGEQAAKAARRTFADAKVSGPARLTPEWIEKELVDPQLAAAVRALSAKVSGGEFVKVGQPMSALVAHYEHVRQQREQLLSRLKRLDRELGELAR